MTQIILFDGVCNLCNGFVQFVIKHDTKNVFQFASLQSEIGQKLLQERNIDTSIIDSVVLIHPGVAYYVKSDAALQIGLNLKGYRTISWLLNLITSNLRNIVYDFIARYRYAWFGKKDHCMVPSPDLDDRFLK